MSVLSLKGVTKHFGETVACQDVTLEVHPGEVLGLLGPSGCGKTTMLRCIAGLEDLTDGEIRLQDKVVAARGYSIAPEKRQIGMVFQSYALWPHMTVEENVGMPLKLMGKPRADRRRLVIESLRKLDLSNLETRYPSELSGGQQQRVALARATVAEPDILLLDEPLSNLDAQLRDRLRDELREELRNLGITAVFVTHDQAEAMAICDRVALLSAGRLVQIGHPRDLYHHPANLFAATFVGRANVLDGKIIAYKEDRVEVQTYTGTRVVATPIGILDVGDHVQVVIRPEKIDLRSELKTDRSSNLDTNRWRAKIIRTVFMGSRIDLVIEVDGVELRAEIIGNFPEPRPGDVVQAVTDTATTRCFHDPEFKVSHVGN